MTDRILLIHLPGAGIVPELSDTLLHSYREALYRVRAPGGNIDLRIGRRSPELAALLRIRGVRSAAFLTACNPRSEIRPPAWNTQAARRLRAALRVLGLRTLTGLGLDERGKWPEEESVLALGITRDQAATLGRRFGQHAVVWVDADARPRLLTCGENADVR
jgi:hypothetical protein